MEVGGRGFKGSGGNDSLGGQKVGGCWSEGHGNGREGDENQLQKKKSSQMPSESLILVS